MGKINVPKGYDPSPLKHWYLVANRTVALFYEGESNGHIHQRSRIDNPDGRLTGLELTTDRAGRSFSSSRSGVRHGFEPKTRPQEDIARKFARKIASALDRAVEQSECTDLVVIAEPRFLGILNKELPKRVKSVVRQELHRDWTQGTDRELESFLRKKLA